MYLLDADVFIRAKNDHYGFDIVPGFWTWLLDANAAGRVFSVQKIAEELRDGGDELADWVRACPDTFFLGPDDEVVGAFHTVAAWAASPSSRLPGWRGLPPDRARSGKRLHGRDSRDEQSGLDQAHQDP